MEDAQIKTATCYADGLCWTHGLTNSLGCLHGCLSRPQSMSFDRFLTRWAAARPDPTSPSLTRITKFTYK